MNRLNDLGYTVKKSEPTGMYYKNGQKVLKTTWECPFWKAWDGMLVRCSSSAYKKSKNTYVEASCIPEWYTASVFKEWMEQQDWQGKQLDKDIIVRDNKIYSPETCAFVSRQTNMFIVASDATRGNFPLGVSWHKGAKKFIAYCRDNFTHSRAYLGLFITPEEAHEAWRKRKHELAQLVAETETDVRVKEALKKRYSFEEWYKTS